VIGNINWNVDLFGPSTKHHQQQLFNAASVWAVTQHPTDSLPNLHHTWYRRTGLCHNRYSLDTAFETVDEVQQYKIWLSE
jgi:hypothetical protein